MRGATPSSRIRGRAVRCRVRRLSLRRARDERQERDEAGASWRDPARGARRTRDVGQCAVEGARSAGQPGDDDSQRPEGRERCPEEPSTSSYTATLCSSNSPSSSTSTQPGPASSRVRPAGMGRVRRWRGAGRVRCVVRRFRRGAQSGSRGPVSTPCPPNRPCGSPATGSPVGSCTSHTECQFGAASSYRRSLAVPVALHASGSRSCTASSAVPLSDAPPSLFTP